MTGWIDLPSEKGAAGNSGSAAVNRNLLFCMHDQEHTPQLLPVMDTSSTVLEFIRERVKRTTTFIRPAVVERFSGDTGALGSGLHILVSLCGHFELDFCFLTFSKRNVFFP